MSVIGGYLSFDSVNKPLIDHNKIKIRNNQVEVKSIIYVQNQNKKEIIIEPQNFSIDLDKSYSIFNTKLFLNLKDSLENFCTALESNCVGNIFKKFIQLNEDYCIELKNDNISVKRFLLSFPDLIFNIDGKEFLWKANSFFYRYIETNKNYMCFLFKEGLGSKNILGKSFFTNYDINFDFENDEILISKADCMEKNWTTYEKSTLESISFSKIYKKKVDNSSIEVSNEINDEKSEYLKCSELVKVNYLIGVSSFLLFFLMVCFIAFFKLKNGDSFLCFKGHKSYAQEFRQARVPNNNFKPNPI